jgi:hypothetical protein
MYELEVVTVRPNTEDGETVRLFETGLVTEKAARATADALILLAGGHISVTHIVHTGRLRVSLAYTGPHGQIIGYANIVQLPEGD